MTLAAIVGALYRALHPERAKLTGAASWFLRELRAKGVQVSRTRVHVWLHEGLPAGRHEEVGRVLKALHKRAFERKKAELAEIRAIPGRLR